MFSQVAPSEHICFPDSHSSTSALQVQWKLYKALKYEYISKTFHHTVIHIRLELTIFQPCQVPWNDMSPPGNEGCRLRVGPWAHFKHSFQHQWYQQTISDHINFFYLNTLCQTRQKNCDIQWLTSSLCFQVVVWWCGQSLRPSLLQGFIKYMVLLIPLS